MIPHQANHLSEDPILFFGGQGGQAVQPRLLQHLTAWKLGVMERAEMTTH